MAFDRPTPVSGSAGRVGSSAGARGPSERLAPDAGGGWRRGPQCRRGRRWWRRRCTRADPADAARPDLERLDRHRTEQFGSEAGREEVGAEIGRHDGLLERAGRQRRRWTAVQRASVPRSDREVRRLVAAVAQWFEDASRSRQGHRARRTQSSSPSSSARAVGATPAALELVGRRRGRPASGAASCGAGRSRHRPARTPDVAASSSPGGRRRSMAMSADSTRGRGWNTVAGTRPTTLVVGPPRRLHRRDAVDVVARRGRDAFGDLALDEDDTAGDRRRLLEQAQQDGGADVVGQVGGQPPHRRRRASRRGRGRPRARRLARCAPAVRHRPPPREARRPAGGRVRPR